MTKHNFALMAAVIGMSAGTSALYPNVSFKSSAKPRKRVAVNHEEKSEIAKWNTEVDRRKAEKKALK